LNPTDADAALPPPASPPERAPLTPAAMWRLSLAGAMVVLFALACVALAFDVPALGRALDLRRLFR
jgi:hypothetical protein